MNEISVCKERKDELYDNWLNETSDEETQEWREDIFSPQEQALIDKWDNNYADGIFNMANDIITKSHKQNQSRLFVDMDGTLAVFKHVDTLETLYEKGYFENLEPQQNVINAVKNIIAENSDIEVNILSAVLTDSKYALDEKNSWLDKYLPEVDRAHRIFTPCGEDKSNYIKNLKETDYLLDDYTKNLTLWEPPGRGIKLLNGINNTHGTWQGEKVSHFDTPAALASKIVDRIVKTKNQPHEDSHEAESVMFNETALQPAPQSTKLHSLKAGKIINTKVKLTPYSKEATGKLFAVKEAMDDGSFTAYKLANNTESRLLRNSLAINADRQNFLQRDSVIMCNELYEFPAGWKHKRMRGSLSTAQMSELNKMTNELLPSVIKLGVEALSDSDKARQLIEGLYSDFENDPKTLAEYLSFKAKFPQLSHRNTMLIFDQNQHATFVAGKGHFETLGYNVLPSQKTNAIKVLRPVQSDYFISEDGKAVPVKNASKEEREKIKNGEIDIKSVKAAKFTYYNIYDISQTDCPRSEYPKVFNMGISSEEHKNYYNKLVNLMERMDVDVTVKDLRSIALSGYFSHADNSITINALLDDTQKLSTMCHEAAHALLHKTSTQTTVIKEFEAQSTAILTLSKLGLPLEQNDVSYLCNYLTKAKVDKAFSLNRSLERVIKQVSFISNNIGLNENQSPLLSQSRANFQEHNTCIDKSNKLTIIYEN